MEYLTLSVRSDARGLIYEKDFRVTDVFGPCVRTHASNLARDGLLKENDLYHATITPLYGEQTQFELVAMDAAAAKRQRHGGEWLTLLPGENGAAAGPMSAFRIDLWKEPPGAKGFRQNCRLSEIDYLTENVKLALVSTRLIRADDAVSFQLYARSGDAPRFDRESIHAAPAAADGFEIRVESAEQHERILEKTMPVCACGGVERAPASQLAIFFRRDGYRRLNDFVSANATREQEVGGVLVGDVFREPGRGRLYVEIEDFIPAEQAHATEVSLRFTHQTFQELRARRERQFPGKRIVGWYHTHPPVKLDLGRGPARLTTKFFSSADLALHQRIFSEPWQVAMVLDAGSSEEIMFRWAGKTVAEADFHLF